MTKKMNILLLNNVAAQPFDESTLITPTADALVIHTQTENRFEAIQQGARKIATMGIKQPRLSGEGWCVESQFHFYQGFYSPLHQGGIEYAPLEEEDSQLLQAQIRVYNWVKALINATPEDLSPLKLAERAEEFIRQLGGTHVTSSITSGEELKDKNYAGIYGVGRGSDRPPALLTLDYNPTGQQDAEVDVALVGKGITFDSGGYSIKSTDGMLYMKIDMGGAATVTAALALAILNGLNKRVRLILCCAENLISGHAYKLSDIIQYRNGTTVEVSNTDAEGRLVLADGLIDASNSGAKMIVDAATLTGAAVVAVGTRYNAIMSLDKKLQNDFLKIAEQENELHWPLPLNKWHADECPSAFADTQNSRPVKGGGAAGASNAAGFLSRFVGNEGEGWLHIDLAAVSCDSANKFYAAGATGHGVRSIARLLLA